MKLQLLLLLSGVFARSALSLDTEWMPVSLKGMQYPLAANHAQISGAVTLQVRISEDGSVTEVISIHGNRILADAAVANIKLWKFKPACRIGQNVGEPVLRFKYIFKLEGEAQYRPRSHFEYEHPYIVKITSEAQLRTH
jgi:TonB family protein